MDAALSGIQAVSCEAVEAEKELCLSMSTNLWWVLRGDDASEGRKRPKMGTKIRRNE